MVHSIKKTKSVVTTAETERCLSSFCQSDGPTPENVKVLKKAGYITYSPHRYWRLNEAGIARADELGVR